MRAALWAREGAEGGQLARIGDQQTKSLARSLTKEDWRVGKLVTLLSKNGELACGKPITFQCGVMIATDALGAF
jgi:hypothetical protein